MGYLVPRGLVGLKREVRAHARTMARKCNKGACLQEAAGPMVDIQDVDCDVVTGMFSRASAPYPLVWLPLAAIELTNADFATCRERARQLLESPWGVATMMGDGPSRFLAGALPGAFLRGVRDAQNELESIGARYRRSVAFPPAQFSRAVAPGVEATLMGMGVPREAIEKQATVRELLEKFAAQYEKWD